MKTLAHLTRDAIQSRYVCYVNFVARVLSPIIRLSFFMTSGICPGINFEFILDMTFCALSLDVADYLFDSTLCTYLILIFNVISVFRTCFILHVNFTVTVL